MDALDCLDSSIVLGTIFEEEPGNHIQYLRTVGYRLRNRGFLTIPLVGEIFTNLFTKIYQRVENQARRKILLEKAVDFFDDIIVDLLLRDRLIISKIKDSDYQYIPRIKELDYAITDDDALHLSSAINNGCQRFMTIDKVLLGERFRSNIKREFGLVITSPT